ncbi:MAG: L-aspartate oxidase [Oscillospiraceae bacterium]
MREKYDVLIVGAGVAGLYAALNLDDNINALIVCKGSVKLCNSSLAQGGVAAVLDDINDNTELHFNDTMIAGGQINDKNAVSVLVKEGPRDVRKIIELGADFDKVDGKLHMTLEGGHSRHRIVHHKDSTGEEMMKTLISTVEKLPNIEMIQNTSLCFLDETNGGFFATLLSEDGFKIVGASFVIMATGGIGRVYQYTTNSAIATGDGIAISADLGATIKNLHLIQFHPTAFAAAAGRERFLISEAVRGEGAVLLNCDGKRFMDRYDERLELAPRDIVSRAIILESRRTGSESFYLDITHRESDFIKNRFPMIYDRCLREGVDITTMPIPVFPCHHYLMGGINVDLNSRTRINRLYAVGECSHTGVHGRNRLASNSLLEALVFGRRAADDINRSNATAGSVSGEPVIHRTDGAPMPSGMRTSIRNIMQKAYFVIPDLDAAHKNYREINDICTRLYKNKFMITNDYLEAKSLARIASIIMEEVIN